MGVHRFPSAVPPLPASSSRGDHSSCTSPLSFKKVSAALTASSSVDAVGAAAGVKCPHHQLCCPAAPPPIATGEATAAPARRPCVGRSHAALQTFGAELRCCKNSF
ncbi:hypothetical protein PVAP13_8NG154201 [Panicum virgatum]|uniref:Uncharacterized protein n=1 Tax=Panicum virgatum TaxID=38727 RepID=A0A8T0PED8_PANVG|nr:hypothetical protein PVAP13_8NG154201 [Panicum virgatum]